MSFHRKSFLVWPALMISVGASAMVAAHLEPAPSEVKGEMEQLIEAARAHAKGLAGWRCRGGSPALGALGNRSARTTGDVLMVTRVDRLALSIGDL